MMEISRPEENNGDPLVQVLQCLDALCQTHNRTATCDQSKLVCNILAANHEYRSRCNAVPDLGLAKKAAVKVTDNRQRSLLNSAGAGFSQCIQPSLPRSQRRLLAENSIYLGRA